MLLFSRGLHLACLKKRLLLLIQVELSSITHRIVLTFPDSATNLSLLLLPPPLSLPESLSMDGPILGDAMSSLPLYSGVQKKQPGSGGCHHVDSLASSLHNQLTYDLQDSDNLTTSPSSSSSDTCSSATHTHSLDTVSSTSQRLFRAFSKTGEASHTIFLQENDPL